MACLGVKTSLKEGSICFGKCEAHSHSILAASSFYAGRGKCPYVFDGRGQRPLGVLGVTLLFPGGTTMKKGRLL